MRLAYKLYLAVYMAIGVIAIDTQAQQKTMPLTLTKALELASEQGFENRIALQNKYAAEAAVKQSRATFLPQLSVEEMAVKTNDPIGVFGIKLRQGIITNADFNPATLNDPDASHNFTTKFELLQPIFNLDRFAERKAAKYQYQSVEEQLQATRQQIALQVKQVYYQLAVLDKQISVQEKFLDTTNEFVKQAEDYYDQGIINKSDLLSAKVKQLEAEQMLANAKKNRDAVNDQLLILIGSSENEQIIIEDIVVLNTDVDEQNTIGMYSENAELRALFQQKKASEAMLNASKFSFAPSLNVFGAYEMHDENIFGNKSDNYTIGASLKWNIFKGFSNAGRVSQRKAEMRKVDLMYEQKMLQHKAEIREAQRSISQAVNQFQITELVLEQSTEESRIRSNRYSQGLEKTADVLTAETKKLESNLKNLQAYFQYQISLAQLEYLLETELN